MSVAEKLTAIADKIRRYTAGEEPLTLDDMASEIDTVYDNGHDNGLMTGEAQGRREGVEQGKKDAYDEFWDEFQQNGTREDYTSAFSSQWGRLFKPKYQIKPTKAGYMFFNNQGEYLTIPDFVEYCDALASEQGKTPQTHPEMFVDGHYQLIDFSQCENVMYALGALHSNHFGTLDFSNCRTSTGYLFFSHETSPTNSVTKIDKIKSSEITKWSSPTFQHAKYLEEITMSGVIATSIDFGTCPLNKASIISVVNVLSDEVTGQTATFNKLAKEAVFTEDEWETLIAPKRAKGWNFVLA